jgi:Anti-sigma-K factor rskA
MHALVTLSEMRRRRTDTAELEALLAEQEQTLARPYSAVAEVEAPQRLRRSIEAQRHASTTRAPRRLAVGAAAAALVAAAAVGAFALSSGGAGPSFSAALAATSLAPGAKGEAILVRRPSGWRVRLDATGLPRLANGAFYEAWLRNDTGVLVPIGTFNDGRDVTLWAGVTPTDFTTLTVTRERVDGDQSSSGEKVLVGTVTPNG